MPARAQEAQHGGLEDSKTGKVDQFWSTTVVGQRGSPRFLLAQQLRKLQTNFVPAFAFDTDDTWLKIW